MQVANTLNNTIRILFNPKIETFKLFDFLIVKSDNIRYIAEIIEIYDDKFDASQNVAKLKLFYRITEKNEVMPYDNFTPNKECEIIKIKQEEIETFINQDKETFIFGTNVKSQSSLQIQYEFFNNNAVVLADKVENANSITYNLAKNLSKKKNVVIVDSTGILEYEDVKIIKAGKNFRMPLNYQTIDYIFDKCLIDASLEFQEICGAILNEIKRFAKKQESEFIPFNIFTKVILEQYRATPYTELKLLLTRLKRFQMNDIFAKNKSDKENLAKAINKNKITILDLSQINSFWQKPYIEYIISDIEEEIYLLTRINDEHFDSDIINNIYNKKKNINFVPNVSYNYKKLPTVMQYCKNYILLPSLYQRTDFLDANFALSNLIEDGCIIFGQNTDDFLYLATDYELNTQEKRKNYRKIALSLTEQEDEEDFKIQSSEEELESKTNISDSERLIQELSDFESQQQEAIKQVEFEKNLKEKESSDDNHKKISTPEIIEENVLIEETKDDKSIENQEIIIDDNDNNDIEHKTKSNISKEDTEENQVENEEIENTDILEKDDDFNIEVKKEASDDFQELDIIQEETQPIISKEIIEEEDDDDVFQTTEIENDDISLDTENNLIIDDEDNVIFQNDNIDENNEINSDRNDKDKTFQFKNKEQEKKVIDILSNEDSSKNTPTLDILDQEDSPNDMSLSDEELDFFQIAQDSANEYEESEEESANGKTEDDEIDLNEIANKSIDNNFEDIINTKNQEKIPTIKIDNKTEIKEEPIEKKENLPIFKENKTSSKKTTQYVVGDIVSHKRYGKGKVVKTIKYEERQLLQIEFDTSGKKLLDPTVADIKLEQ